MTTWKKAAIWALILMLGGVFVAEAWGSPQTPPARVEVVKNELVCMITNKVFQSAQIPVVVEGRTYYGCCDMCKERLEGQEAARKAVDPVSKVTIDKATAIIGATSTGDVVYFQSLATMKAYNAQATK